MVNASIPKGLRLLFIGQHHEGTNGADRIRTLQEFGCEVTAFETRPIPSPFTRVEQRLATRFNVGPPVWSLNRQLQSFLESLGRFDIAWINKGVWITPKTLQKIAQKSGVTLHFTLDSQFIDNRSHLLFKSIPSYDLLVTTKDFEKAEYIRMGARKVQVVRQGFGPRILKAATSTDDPRFDSDVTFIGHCQPYYADVLKQVSHMGVDLKIWGPHWGDYASENPWAKKVVQGNGLHGVDYGRALRQARITLCLLSKRGKDAVTTRSMEIPAAGGFMLAERTPEHEALFVDRQEAVFFSTIEELKAAIDTYLNDEPARRRIALAGQHRAMRSGYSEADQVLATLSAALSSTSERASAMHGALDVVDDKVAQCSMPVQKEQNIQ